MSTTRSNGQFWRGVCLTMFQMCTLLTQQNVEDYILELFKHVLTPTYLCSDGQFYEQTDVLAMVQVSPVIVYFFMTAFEKKTIEEATWLLSSSVCVLELVIFRLNFEYLQSGISRLCTQLLHRTMCLLLNRTKSYHLYASFHGVVFWRRSRECV
jgi:hypothetical protein